MAELFRFVNDLVIYPEVWFDHRSSASRCGVDSVHLNKKNIPGDGPASEAGVGMHLLIFSMWYNMAQGLDSGWYRYPDFNWSQRMVIALLRHCWFNGKFPENPRFLSCFSKLAILNPKFIISSISPYHWSLWTDSMTGWWFGTCLCFSTWGFP